MSTTPRFATTNCDASTGGQAQKGRPSAAAISRWALIHGHGVGLANSGSEVSVPDLHESVDLGVFLRCDSLGVPSLLLQPLAPRRGDRLKGESYWLRDKDEEVTSTQDTRLRVQASPAVIRGAFGSREGSDSGLRLWALRGRPVNLHCFREVTRRKMAFTVGFQIRFNVGAELCSLPASSAERTPRRRVG